MPAKKKKPPMGAEFRDDEYTSKGKPVKKKEPKEKSGAKEAPAPKAAKSPKEKSSKAPETEENDNIYNSRTVSVLLFAAGVLVALMTFIPGTAGWNAIHKFMLGLFGIAAFFVPAILIYTSVLIGLEKGRDNVTRKAVIGIIMTLLTCSALQVFMVGEVPGHTFSENVSQIYKDGTRLIGGGIAGLPISGLLLALLGKMGARIVAVLLFFVLWMLLTNKGIIEFFQMIAKPFSFIGDFFSGSGYEVVDDDEDDDDDDDEGDILDRDVITADRKMINVREEFFSDKDALGIGDDLAAQNSGIADIPAEPPQSEEEEFSMFFDMPVNEEVPDVPADVPAFAPPVPAEEAPEEEPDFDLERLITRAAEIKAKRDNAVAQEKEEEKEPEVQASAYVLPSVDLLTPPNNNSNSTEAVAEMHEKADTIQNTLKSFGVEVKIRNVCRGPSITRYEVQPGAGVKVSKIKGLEDDIALSLAAQGVRIEAPIPGKAAIGIEVPNINKDMVTLREILESSEFKSSKSKLAFAVGKDIAGNSIVGDITKMPHVIIAGTTGSGKSVCTRSIIMSILYNAKPEEVKLILIDPKVVEFKVFDGIPHLLIPIVTEAKKAAGALNWAVQEMMKRYNIFAEVGATDLKSYNELAADDEELKFMYQIVIFIDELADMMLVAGKEVEDSICRLAQMGRAAGMHLVVATQRPTTDVITGLIKANIPSRIALSVMSQVDSRTIIDMAGADKLLGNGDMLYMPIGMGKPVRVQGCFASSKDINETLTFIRSQSTGEYDDTVIEAVENYVPQSSKGDKGGASESGFNAGSDEDYIVRAAEVAVNNGQVSTTMLQKKLRLGYAKASRIIDELEERGIIGPSEGSKPRKVLMSKMQFDEWKFRMLEE